LTTGVHGTPLRWEGGGKLRDCSTHGAGWASEAGRRTSAWPRLIQSRPCLADALCVGARPW
jgi:hypothetical protein